MKALLGTQDDWNSLTPKNICFSLILQKVIEVMSDTTQMICAIKRNYNDSLRSGSRLF